jgi:AraC-like DNA-binding protein
MLFRFEPKSALLLIFFSHGLVFSMLLLVKSIRLQDKASAWLSAFLLLCTLYIAPFMLGYAGWYSRPPYRTLLFYLPLQQLFLLPPVLYFYLRHLLDRDFHFGRRQWIHFVPALLYLAYSLFVFIADQWVLGFDYFYADGKDKDFAPWYQVSGFLYLAVYTAAGLSLYRRYRALSQQTLSFADSLRFQWAQRFLLALTLLLVLRLFFFVLNPEWGAFGKKFWYYLCFSVLVYFIGLAGWSNTLRSLTSLSLPTLGAGTSTPATLPLRGGWTTEELEATRAAVTARLHEERLFEDPELTLTDLARKLGLPPKKLSAALNNGEGQNFNDLINRCRTEAVIERLKAGDHKTQTLMGLALDAGFNSKSTFNRCFKRYTGLTPRDYLARLDEN